MGKKKRGHPDIEEVLSRPWCYYCERDFDDLKILINHQKAKHFKCERCGRRLNTAGGLSVHMTQVHKETLTTIENALPNRSNLDVEIFGMEGIPDDVVTSHQQRVLGQFAQAEAERRAATGNPGPGGSTAGGVKKPKFEAPSELKKRLAEHKAKKAAEQSGAGSDGDATPVGAGQNAQSPSRGPSPGAFAGSPGYPQPQTLYNGPSNSQNYSSLPQTYNQPPPTYQQQPSLFQPPQQQKQQQQQQPQQFNFPQGMQQYQSPQSFAPPSHFSPPGGQAFQPPQYQNGPSRSHGAISSPGTFQQGQYQPPHPLAPPQNGPPPQRPAGLPPAPGLPQRPSFGAPSVNAFQMQQMHQGQVPGPPNALTTALPNQQVSPQQQPGGLYGNEQVPNGYGTSQALSGQTQEARMPIKSSALDDSNRADFTAVAENKMKVHAEEPSAEKKGKKEKDKGTKLVYSDNEISPEEKMAQLPRYAFVPDGKEESVLGEAATAAVARVSVGPDDVLDKQD